MRPVDADKLVEEYKRLLQRFEEMGDDSAATAIELCRHKAECVAPTLEVAPIIHAHWINVWQDGLTYRGTCSHCRVSNDIPHPWAAHYCPNCGAKMDEEM